MVEVGPNSIKNEGRLGVQRPAPRSGADPTLILGSGESSQGMGLPDPIDPKSPTRSVPVVQSENAHVLPPGMKLGAVRVGKKIGAGNMGIVYLGHHESLDRPVVVKTLSPQRLLGNGSAEVIARFYEEARSVARLSHQNIAQIFDVGRHKGFHYLIMEYVDGCSLGDYLKSKVLSLEEKVCLVLGIASGLRAAHKCGVVHRDIKPDNIMINQEGQAKIVDFGLAKRHGSAGLTSDQTVLGTPYFMAPEQCDGRDVDGRSDLYALGVTAFWMFSGEYPFNGKHPVQVIMARLRQPAPLIQKINPHIPPSLARIINRLLLADPKERFQNAKDLIHELSTLTLGEQGSNSGSAGKIAFPAVERSNSSSKSHALQDSKNWPWLLAAGSGLILLVSLIGFVVVRNKIRDARDRGASQAEERMKTLEAGENKGEGKEQEVAQKNPTAKKSSEHSAKKDWPLPSEAQNRLLKKLAQVMDEATKFSQTTPFLRGERGERGKSGKSGKKGKKGRNRRFMGEAAKKVRRLGENLGSTLGEFYAVSKVEERGAFDEWTQSAFRFGQGQWSFGSYSEFQKVFSLEGSLRPRALSFGEDGLRPTRKRSIVTFNLKPEHESFDSARFQFSLTDDESSRHDFLVSFYHCGQSVVFTKSGYAIFPGDHSETEKGGMNRSSILSSALRRGIPRGQRVLSYQAGEKLTIFIHQREDGSEWIVKDSNSVQRFFIPSQSKSKGLQLKVGYSTRFLSLELGEKTVGHP